MDEIQVATNLSMLQGNFEWYESFLSLVSVECKKESPEIHRLGRELLPFPECLKYFHLGNPDLIVVRPRSPQLSRDL